MQLVFPLISAAAIALRSSDGLPADCARRADVVGLFDVSRTATIARTRETLKSAFIQAMMEVVDARFSLAVSSDKPLQPAGFENDVCATRLVPFTSKLAEVTTATEHATVLKGGDVLNAQLDAIARTALSSEWRGPDHALSILMIATSALFHKNGDFGDIVAAFEEVHGKTDVNIDDRPITVEDIRNADNNLNALCLSLEYPSLDTVRAILHSKRIFPIFLVGPTGWPCSETVPAGFEIDADGFCSFPELEHEYTEIIGQPGREPEDETNQKNATSLDKTVRVYENLLEDLAVPGLVLPVHPIGGEVIIFDELFENALSKSPDMVDDYCRNAVTPVPTGPGTAATGPGPTASATGTQIPTTVTSTSTSQNTATSRVPATSETGGTTNLSLLVTTLLITAGALILTPA